MNYLIGRSDVDVSDFVKEDDGERTGEKSALHIAAIHDSAEIAKALLDRGCKADQKDKMVCYPHKLCKANYTLGRQSPKPPVAIRKIQGQHAPPPEMFEI